MQGRAEAHAVLDAVCQLRDHARHVDPPVAPKPPPANFGRFEQAPENAAYTPAGPAYNPTNPPCVDRGLPTVMTSVANRPYFPGITCVQDRTGACSGADNAAHSRYFRCTDATKQAEGIRDSVPKFGCYYNDGQGQFVRGSNIPAASTCDCEDTTATPKFGRPFVGCTSYGQPFTDEQNPPRPQQQGN